MALSPFPLSLKRECGSDAPLKPPSGAQYPLRLDYQHLWPLSHRSVCRQHGQWNICDKQQAAQYADGNSQYFRFRLAALSFKGAAKGRERAVLFQCVFCLFRHSFRGSVGHHSDCSTIHPTLGRTGVLCRMAVCACPDFGFCFCVLWLFSVLYLHD